MTVASELRRLCAEKGVTGYRLSVVLEVDSGSTYRWLAGSVIPDIGSIARVAEVLSLTDTELAGIVRAAQRPQEPA